MNDSKGRGERWEERLKEVDNVEKNGCPIESNETEAEKVE